MALLHLWLAAPVAASIPASPAQIGSDTSPPVRVAHGTSARCEPHPLQAKVVEAALAGRGATAIEAATKLVEEIDREEDATCPSLASAPAYLHLTLLRFRRWQEILDLPPPAEERTVARAIARYARGVALAAQERWDEARAELYDLRLGAYTGTGPRNPVVQIAVHSLGGEISLRYGGAGDAVELFGRAVRLWDALPDAETAWPYTPRDPLGWALLEAGRPAEAGSTFRAALERRPEDGWALFGLVRALEALGRENRAAEARSRFDEVWRSADTEVEPSSDRSPQRKHQ